VSGFEPYPAPEPLGLIEVVEVYVDYEEPLLWLGRGAAGLYLVVLIDDGDEQVWTFAPIGEERLANLRAGRMDLHDAFLHADGGSVVLLHREKQIEGRVWCEVRDASTQTDDMLPDVGTTLPPWEAA
jgi:hypothetical protein